MREEMIVRNDKVRESFVRTARVKDEPKQAKLWLVSALVQCPCGTIIPARAPSSPYAWRHTALREAGEIECLGCGERLHIPMTAEFMEKPEGWPR